MGSVVFLGAPPNADSPPNLILVSLDTLAASAISRLGGPTGLTPEIDRILGQSRSYDQAFAPAGRTLPSHAALFSGLYPHNNSRTKVQEVTFDSLVPELANQGYLTMAEKKTESAKQESIDKVHHGLLSSISPPFLPSTPLLHFTSRPMLLTSPEQSLLHSHLHLSSSSSSRHRW